MIAAVSQEIARLEHVRGLLWSALVQRDSNGERSIVAVKKTRNMSDEARERIALAQKRRWAK